MKPACWLRRLPLAGRCDGQLVRCHLISKDFLKREFPKGVVLIDGAWRKIERGMHWPDGAPARSLHALLNDERVWVWGCGGPTGIGGHHGRLDTAPHDRTRLRVARAMLPPEVEEFAAELGIAWWLDRTYGSL